ncbi:hypothetical protein D3C87_1267820 [compost metagenome]
MNERTAPSSTPRIGPCAMRMSIEGPAGATAATGPCAQALAAIRVTPRQVAVQPGRACC